MYKHNFVRYLFVGGSTFILDLGLLILLHEEFNINVPIATSVAYWVSIAYNFSLNRYWTFNNEERESLRRHLTAYLLLLGFNYLFTVIFVSLMSQVIYVGLAKILAVPIQMLWTYPCYKRYVFVNKS